MYIKSFKTGKEVNIKSCKEPTMRNVRGRTWDSSKISIHGLTTEVYIDYTWGRYGYFEFDGKWYKIEVWDFDSIERHDVSINRGSATNYIELNKNKED